mmetsp:Transcript_4396/g.14235  ORF Transcript_4396/g.14235 Transcript_4396/m.14235 type:complete len:266 (+) Transcript_4396:660-1457(+)
MTAAAPVPWPTTTIVVLSGCRLPFRRQSPRRVGVCSSWTAPPFRQCARLTPAPCCTSRWTSEVGVPHPSTLPVTCFLFRRTWERHTRCKCSHCPCCVNGWLKLAPHPRAAAAGAPPQSVAPQSCGSMASLTTCLPAYAHLLPGTATKGSFPSLWKLPGRCTRRCCTHSSNFRRCTRCRGTTWRVRCTRSSRKGLACLWSAATKTRLTHYRLAWSARPSTMQRWWWPWCVSMPLSAPERSCQRWQRRRVRRPSCIVAAAPSTCAAT